ncbi:ATP-dependent DNA ligase [Calidifontibacter sp. DB0510]|uniref:ATP-dependent DNA ligase n=1 Tax=Metallococcus carri TaxID=1656884 RepID=A0A967EGP5_9MICO|nr:non-homologous end-joining DNA ligase [Metallococcus carri]NHN55353.1 ATP-dependent DNA ligase [Metallococcus carri]NOP36430.1 ATP-dependent DNA ligase [Calidifontibacter sp. DB2511S]
MNDKQQVEVAGRRLAIGNLDKILYPATETTKGEVLHYYATVAPVLLPQLAHRPVTRIRWPEGVGGISFFEKNLPSGAPDWLDRVTFASSGSRGGGDSVTYPLVDDLAGLTYLANLASLEFHVPQWRVQDGDAVNPDRLVVDLDPGAPAGLPECAELALLVRERLADRGYDRTVPVTSGSKGLQVYAALPGSATSDEVRDDMRTLAQELTKAQPERVVWKMTTSLRKGKILLDWSQNTAAKTTICPYSMRGKDRPTVAAPRTWEEMEQGAGAPDTLRQLDITEVMDRLDDLGDLMASLTET